MICVPNRGVVCPAQQTVHGSWLPAARVTIPIDIVGAGPPSQANSRRWPALASKRCSARSAAVMWSAPSIHNANFSRSAVPRIGWHAVRCRGGPHQHLVAHLVTQPVVHRLEIVEVGEQQRSRLVLTIEPVDVAGHLLEEGAAVEQPGHRIGPRLACHLLLDRLVSSTMRIRLAEAPISSRSLSQPREPGERHSATPALAPNPRQDRPSILGGASTDCSPR